MTKLNDAAAKVARLGEHARRKAFRDVLAALGEEHGFDCRSLKARMSDAFGSCDCGAGRVRDLARALLERRPCSACRDLPPAVFGCRRCGGMGVLP